MYALYLAGGDTQRIHTEEIALKCFELFPDSFSWVNHPELPDKDIVRVALTDARKERHGGLVIGRAGQKHGHSAKTSRDPVPDGWMLTSHGLEWIQRNIVRLQQLASSDHLKDHRQKTLRKLKRIKEHRLYIEYTDGPDNFVPMIGDIADMLLCRVDAEPQIWLDRFDKIRRQAQSVDQGDIVDFIDKCHEAYVKQR